MSHILQLGGTMIGSARSARFRTKEGRKEACKQLVERRVDGLICIGGDGSLTGANLLKSEWKEHLASLGLGDSSLSSFDVVGLVGSIDNDLIGFTQTIGADSALHRIIHSVDCIVSTAVSHGRTFIIEVMGRSSGYLALAASIICGSDWVFIPGFDLFLLVTKKPKFSVVQNVQSTRDRGSRTCASASWRDER